MSESAANAKASERPPAKKVVGRPWPKGVSGNPGGRPRIEPRIRKHARRYDQRVIAELWKIGSDPKVDPDVRRKALMDLQSIGSGRPAVVQEVGGKGGGPLVNLNIGAGSSLSPEAVYRAMVAGEIPRDPSIFERPAIEGKATERGEK